MRIYCSYVISVNKSFDGAYLNDMVVLYLIINGLILMKNQYEYKPLDFDQ